MALDITPAKDGGVLKEVLLEGSGDDKPGAGSVVKAHYHGTLTDGTVFDSSVARGEPFEFTLGQGQVIKAWDIGVATMTKGEKAKFTCLSNYAYGKNGSPPKIPADATLIFEITLLSWKEEDISTDSDGGITRTILVQGEGFTSPANCRLCKIHLKGINDGKVFDDRELSFMLGEGVNHNVPRGVEIAITKMKKGEKSRVTLSSKYGWADGNPLFNIPAKASIRYEIELKEFEKDKESWDMDTSEKLVEAEFLKSKATEFFQKQNYPIAIQIYLKANSYIDSDAGFNETEEVERKKILLAIQLNLALAHLKINEGHQSKCHCDNALEIDPKNVKALFRRGQALFSVRDYDRAKVDFEEVAKLEPSNTAALAQINQCNIKIKESREKEKKIYSNMFDNFARKDNEDSYRFGWWDDKQKHPRISDVIPEEKEDLEEKKREKKKQLEYLKRVAEEKRKERELAELNKNTEEVPKYILEENNSDEVSQEISFVEDVLEKGEIREGEVTRHDVSSRGVGEGCEGPGTNGFREGESRPAPAQQP